MGILFSTFTIIYLSLLLSKKIIKTSGTFISLGFLPIILFYFTFHFISNSFHLGSIVLSCILALSVAVLHISGIYSIKQFCFQVITGIHKHLGFSIFVVASSLYQLFQGAYIELPSDPVGVHLFRVSKILILVTLKK